MERRYVTGISDSAIFFVGSEVENSQAKGQRTLFVVGLQKTNDIIDLVKKNKCTHVYLGANQSFTKPTRAWAKLVNELLFAGLWVTLDYEPLHHTWVHSNGLAGKERFISMVSVKIPYIESSRNICVKIDDVDFQSTNRGVWVHQSHTLLNDEVLTDWHEYTSDEIVK